MNSVAEPVQFAPLAKPRVSVAHASNTGSLRAWNLFKQTGARDSLSVLDYNKAEALAGKVYELIRSSGKDVKKISVNTGISEQKIERVKNHLFNNEHILSYGKDKFYPDPLIAETWKRLELGVHTPQDIALFKHELFESKFEGIFKTDYKTAHNAANKAGYLSGVENLTNDHLDEVYRGFLHRYSKI